MYATDRRRAVRSRPVGRQLRNGSVRTAMGESRRFAGDARMHWMAVGRRLIECSDENQGKDEGIVSKSRCPLSLLRRSSGDRNLDYRVGHAVHEIRHQDLSSESDDLDDFSFAEAGSVRWRRSNRAPSTVAGQARVRGLPMSDAGRVRRVECARQGRRSQVVARSCAPRPKVQ